MSYINLKRFVDIDIQPSEIASLYGTRDTIVMFAEEGTSGTQTLITSYSDAESTFASTTNILSFLKVFFDNDGAKVLVIEGVELDDIEESTITALDNSYIGVCICPTSTTGALSVYNKAIELVTALEEDEDVYGINEKIIFTRFPSTETTIDTSTHNYLAAKYSSVVGAEMTMAAYLSQIDVTETSSVYDYAFTEEDIDEEDVTDTVYGSIIENNMNVDIYLAGAVRNCGGNIKNGEDMTNSYIKIILHQYLTDALITLLSQKITSTTGVSKIYTSVCQVLEQFKDCGYLTTDKTWTNGDLVVTYNNVQYTVIEKGTSLILGYSVKVLPLTSLSDEDKANRKAPPVYVVLADQYGIRSITVSGEII